VQQQLSGGVSGAATKVRDDDDDDDNDVAGDDGGDDDDDGAAAAASPPLVSPPLSPPSAIADGELWFGDGIRAAIQVWQGAISGKAPRDRTLTESENAAAGVASSDGGANSFGGHMLLFEALTGRLTLRLTGGTPSSSLPKLLLDALLLRDAKKLPAGFDDESSRRSGPCSPSRGFTHTGEEAAARC
jgi:hypothetical protein